MLKLWDPSGKYQASSEQCIPIHIPGEHFIIAIPGRKTVWMQLKNVFCTVKSMVRISAVICHFCQIAEKNSKHKQDLKVSQLNEDNDEAKIELSFKMEDGKVKVMQKNQ